MRPQARVVAGGAATEGGHLLVVLRLLHLDVDEYPEPLGVVHHDLPLRQLGHVLKVKCDGTPVSMAARHALRKVHACACAWG